MAQHHELLRAALVAAERATDLIRRAVRPAASAWGHKGPHDFVTDVDRAAERLIGETLTAAAPHSVVLGEEFTPDLRSDAPITWVVDPLDGTTNFLHGYPMYAVSIAAVVAGEPVAGVVSDVTRGCTYQATAGDGAWCDGRRLRVSALTDPGRALLGTGFPFKAPATAQLDAYLEQFRRILPRTSGVRRGGSAALDLAHVAEGRLDGFWEFGLSAWDIAAGMLLVREAGGRVTDFAGRPLPVAAGNVVAGGPAVHAWLLGMLVPGAAGATG